MAHNDRTRRLYFLVCAAVVTGAASIFSTAFLAWKGLEQAATTVASTGVAVTTISGAWVYICQREVGSGRHDGGDGPVGPNGATGPDSP
ncbi:hypothetical protein ABZ695_27095 [Streptomyces sp. NPDC006976]|uniref:hypothetical protein n=1 Tax=Streptomyces sp. NPDC006976 TaxID=3154311 RepID=UPI0033E63A7C